MVMMKHDGEVLIMMLMMILVTMIMAIGVAGDDGDYVIPCIGEIFNNGQLDYLDAGGLQMIKCLK
jgi:hypothetical protein